MKFFPVVASAVVALSLTGCSDDDSTTTVSPSTTTSAAAQATTAAMETTTSFLRPTTAPGDSTTAASGEATISSSGSETTAPSDGGSCSATPSGKYCGKYMMFKGTATIDDGTFGLSVKPVVNINGVDYTMDTCTDFEPDYSDPQMAMTVTYDESNDTFNISVQGLMSLDLSKDQC
ncbi:hypothetical protein FOL47_007822 [Perkinsus chesapeaki]|uniref:Uncharacterized protein n=1 Tax=Perkinsus chesapeaki TaxID=330153 RepID=A0A7J6LHR5_PERCH|nr:hypothetical protein FOL47_007822 [Perkinsus chesapeaki]